MKKTYNGQNLNKIWNKEIKKLNKEKKKRNSKNK